MTDAIGIDAGSYKTVLACVKQRGIEIVLSETSNKSTPTIAAYTPQERLIGDSASNQMKKNFKNTMQFFQRFLGLNQDCADQVAEEKKFITYKCIDLENKKLGFEVQSRGVKEVFAPEQVMAFYLKKAKTYFEKAGMNSNEMVISVPNYASNCERQAYIDAAEIAGIKCIRLINEGTATALTYGFFRKADLDADKPRIVCFVDFGHSKLSVTFASFVKGKMKVLGTHSNKNLGARQIDYQLFDMLGGEFAKKYGCDPRESPRCRLRLLDSIEKARKLLTANKEADVHCESLMEDEDLHRHFKREELEELMAPFIVDFRKVLEESLEKCGIDKSKIDFVELVGEATRIPICIQQIKEVYGKDPSRTLNSTDCIARGCALQAAMLSPNFQVAQFQIEEYNNFPVSIIYKFKGTDKLSNKELFKVGSSFPSTKSITFDNKMGNLDLLIQYSEGANVMQGIPAQIAQYDIGEVKPDEKTEKYSFVMRVSNNIHNIPCLDQAEFVQEWTEEEKIPIKMAPAPKAPEPKKEEEKKEGEAPKEGEAEKTEKPAEPEKPAPEQQYEIKKRSKKTHTPINFKTQSYALAPAQRKQYQQRETDLVICDNDILEMKELRNNLEAYSYEMRNNLDSYGSWEKYLDDATKATFLQEINQVVDWIYGDGEQAPKEEYKKLIEKFKAIGEPVKQRHFYYTELDVYYMQFDKAAKDIQAKLESSGHLTGEQIEVVIKRLEEARKFFDSVKADQTAKKLFENPSFSLNQIIQTLSLLKSETDAVFNAPPPKVDKEMKEEPKSSEKKEEGAPQDAEMKNEEPAKEAAS